MEELWAFLLAKIEVLSIMSARLCIEVLSEIVGSTQEIKFFEANEWTAESEKKLLAKIQDLLSVIRHCGKSFEIKIHTSVSNVEEAVFLIKKKLNNTIEIKNQKLSIREIEVLGLIMQGYTNNEIAEKLFVCYETIKSHRKNILLKTGAKNTAALINHYHQTFFEKEVL